MDERIPGVNAPPEGVVPTPIEKVIQKKIGVEQIRKASETLKRYKQGKANLDNKIVENEQWWKLRHWDYINTDRPANDIEPTSAWLFNTLANKHADAMDNFPIPNILPREESDQGQAKMLSSIIPVIHQQNDFEEVYDDVWWYKIKHGCGVYKVLWNSQKLNGLGDIDIRRADILNLFWEPGITDIQESPEFFQVELRNNEQLKAEYPEIGESLSTPSIMTAKYLYDDAVETSDKSVIVDWYYKKNVGGRTVLHYCKFVNDVVLFATENNPEKYPNGWYNHGKYPFIFDNLFPVEGSPCGFGYIDVCRNPQKYIDLLGRAILKNAVVNSTPRYMVKDKECGINETELMDVNSPVVHCEVMLSDDFVRPIVTNTLSDTYVAFHNNKIEELKETSGNRDVSNGGTTSGITAASAIAAMQEAGSKLSRDMIKSSYRAFNRLVIMEIELIRQFYENARSFRIIGEQAAVEFVSFSNAKIKPQHQGMDFGADQGYRMPLFDVEVSAQKASPYSKMSQNEMALQFYQLGFFNPQFADQALACIDMMDFDRKDSLIAKIQQNGTMFQQMQIMQQQLLKLSQIVDMQNGSSLTQAMAPEMGQPIPNAGIDIRQTESTGNETGNSIIDNAKRRVANSTSPT